MDVGAVETVRPQTLLRPAKGLVARFCWCLRGWLADVDPTCGSRVRRSRRSPGGWITGASPHHTMACSDVGEKVTDGAGSSVAVEWPDPEGGDGAPIPVGRLRWHLRNQVAVATTNGQACAEWATRGGERRNTAAYGHGISLPVCV